MADTDPEGGAHWAAPRRPPWGPVLVGMRGSGKSTVAPIVARRLGLGWVDSDAELERREGQTIPELFEKGEAHFRGLESRLLVELLQRPEIVLATGGGGVLHPPIRDLCARRFTVWLDAPPPVLAQRIQGSSRPSLTERSLLDELRHLLVERAPWYREASTLRIDVGTDSPETVAERVADAWTLARSREG
ncbi:MAG: shikimate kinase [Gemmatimonadota bacterium]|nr:shikimate kinase [Gemmatimonadota bacterium]